MNLCAPGWAGARQREGAAILRALLIGVAATLFATMTIAAPPLAGSWSITPNGSAASSGELLFRVAGASGNPVDVRVAVSGGSDEVAIAREIRAALAARPRNDLDVTMGEGANVLVTDPRGRPTFSIELIESNIDGLRVNVRAIEPAATPTVPSQAEPATAPSPPTPREPGAPARTPPPLR